MSNALTFTLNLENYNFSAPAQRAITEIEAIGSSAARARGPLLQLESGLLVTKNAANLASVAARQLRLDFTALAATQASSQMMMGNSMAAMGGKGIRSGLGGKAAVFQQAGTALTQLGVYVAPQAVFGLQAATQALRALRTGALALGLRGGPAVAVIAAIVAALAGLGLAGTKAVGIRAAEKDTLKSVEQAKEDRWLLQAELQGKVNAKVIPQEFANQLNSILFNAYGKSIATAVARVREMLDATSLSEDLAKDLDSTRSLINRLNIESIADPIERQKALIRSQAESMRQEAKSSASKPWLGPQLMSSISQWETSQIAQVIEKAMPKLEIPMAQSRQISELERMGFVFGSGVNGSSKDEAIARATAGTERVLKQYLPRIADFSTKRR